MNLKQCKSCLDIIHLSKCKCGRFNHMGKSFSVQKNGTDYGYKFKDYVVSYERNFIYKSESD